MRPFEDKDHNKFKKSQILKNPKKHGFLDSIKNRRNEILTNNLKKAESHIGSTIINHKWNYFSEDKNPREEIFDLSSTSELKPLTTEENKNLQVEIDT